MSKKKRGTAHPGPKQLKRLGPKRLGPKRRSSTLRRLGPTRRR